MYIFVYCEYVPGNMTPFLKAYVRISIFEQNTDRQLEGIKLDKVFTDKTKVARDCGI